MIEFDEVVKEFPGPENEPIRAVDALSLRIEEGSTHALIGTSGCGKTTTLRLVNRLEQPSSGAIRVGGEDVADVDPITLRRRTGYVVQERGLFPHMSVARNVGLLGEREQWTRERREARVRELLDLVGLPPDEYAARYPSELSGGQQQRVGVARALFLDPERVLMDEPFGALDPITRQQIQQEFRALLKEAHKTVLLVTHDLDEAFEMADRVTLLHEGREIQTGTPQELKEEPATPFVQDFVSHHVTRG